LESALDLVVHEHMKLVQKENSRFTEIGIMGRINEY
jgi:hypothetical protein